MWVNKTLLSITFAIVIIGCCGAAARADVVEFSENPLPNITLGAGTQVGQDARFVGAGNDTFGIIASGTGTVNFINPLTSLTFFSLQVTQSPLTVTALLNGNVVGTFSFAAGAA